MKCRTCLITTLVAFVLLHLLFAQKAYACQNVCAYIDPGTGSFIIQVIVGVLFGGLFVLKLFWNNVKAFFKKLFSKGKKHEKK